MKNRKKTPNFKSTTNRIKELKKDIEKRPAFYKLLHAFADFITEQIELGNLDMSKVLKNKRPRARRAK